MQGVHHKSFCNEREERQKGEGNQNKRKTSQTEANLGKFGRWLFLLDYGTELARRQCHSRRTTKKDGGNDENATRSADQRKQLDGGSLKKVEAAKR